MSRLFRETSAQTPLSAWPNRSLEPQGSCLWLRSGRRAASVRLSEDDNRAGGCGGPGDGDLVRVVDRDAAAWVRPLERPVADRLRLLTQGTEPPGRAFWEDRMSSSSGGRTART